jgi:hypothetical protein
MEIDRQNYEQYFMDYLDGILNEEQTEVLLAFLEFNPDLKNELAGLEKMHLTPDETSYDSKDSLLRAESELAKATILKDFDMYCISSMEQDITSEDEEILQEIIREDSEREATYRLYKTARLMPDETIVYPGKVQLKKRFIGIPYRIILPAAAAVAAMLILLQLFTGRESEPGIQTLAEEFPQPVPEDPVSNPAPMINAEQGPEENFPEPMNVKAERQIILAEKSGKGDDSSISKEKVRMEKLGSISIRNLENPDAEYGRKISDHPEIQHTRMFEQYLSSSIQSAEDSRLSWWFLADAGVRGLNSISEDEYRLDLEKNKDGNTRKFTLDTPVFGISAPLRKTDKQR